MRVHAYLLAAAHFALSLSLSVPRLALMAPKRKKPRSAGEVFLEEIGFTGDGATKRACEAARPRGQAGPRLLAERRPILRGHRRVVPEGDDGEVEAPPHDRLRRRRN